MEYQVEDESIDSLYQSASDEELVSDDENRSEIKRITIDGIQYALFDDNTATIIDCNFSGKNFEVPSNLEDDDEFYIINEISPKALKNTKIEEISFRGDCSISFFGRDSLFCHSLKKISFPIQLNRLEQGWCSFTIKLSDIDIGESNKHFSFENGILYDHKKTILYFCSRKKSSVVIPSTVKIISSYAFEQCRRLETVTFEDQSQLEEIQPWAFSRSHIRSINIPKTVKEIHCNAFFWCKRLREVNFNEDSNLNEIHHAAFKDTQITEITLPKSTTRIGKNAFQNCSFLEELTVYHKGELDIEKNAFKNVNKEFVMNVSTQTKLKGKGYLNFSDKIHQFDD